MVRPVLLACLLAALGSGTALSQSPSGQSPRGVHNEAYDGRGLGLTAAQERAVYNAASGMPGEGPDGFIPWIGGELPASVQLRPLPEDVARMLQPPVRNYRLARLDDKALIVMPENRTIVDIVTLTEKTLGPAGTTGAGDPADKEYRLNTNPQTPGAGRADPPTVTNDPATLTSDYPVGGAASPKPVPEAATRAGNKTGAQVPRAGSVR